MLRLIKLMIAMSAVLLSACGSIGPATAEEQETKVKTAKINAQLGLAYLEQKNIQRAKQKLLLALSQAPEIPETAYSMAYFLEATGNKKLAEHYYIQAVNVAPTRGDAHNNYGTFLCRSGEYNRAITHFSMAVNDPDYLDPADAYENAGLCALKIPNSKQAMKYFEMALTQDPSRPISLLKLAELHYKQGNYRQTKAKLNEFLAIAPPNSKTAMLSANLARVQAVKQPVIVAETETDTDTNTESYVPAGRKIITYSTYLTKPDKHFTLRKPKTVTRRDDQLKQVISMKLHTKVKPLRLMAQAKHRERNRYSSHASLHRNKRWNWQNSLV